MCSCLASSLHARYGDFVHEKELHGGCADETRQRRKNDADAKKCLSIDLPGAASRQVRALQDDRADVVHRASANWHRNAHKNISSEVHELKSTGSRASVPRHVHVTCAEGPFQQPLGRLGRKAFRRAVRRRYGGRFLMFGDGSRWQQHVSLAAFGRLVLSGE